MSALLQDQTILITGGTGSFGHAFTKIALGHDPRKIIIFSRDEYKQGRMEQRFQDGRLRFFLGDVRDLERLKLAFRGVDLVIHAAALKQVPKGEYNPSEFLKTNVQGAQNVIDAALAWGPARVIALSTDKAVNPVNHYGATKLAAEKLFIASNAYSGGPVPSFSVVRYGNVAGSRGSVIPVFRDQAGSGRITITDRRMSRFWITLEESVQFVLDCLAVAEGGEVFVPKLPSFMVETLAYAMAKPGDEIVETGIREGEKLAESLVGPDELVTDYPHHYRIHAGGIRIGTAYASDTNDVWLTKDDLRGRL